MSVKQVRKIGFFSALTMLVGSVVGIGIFFKNGAVLEAANGNGATALTGWILGGLLALGAAVSFSELGSLKIKNISGLPAWSRVVGGKEYGYLVKVTFCIFYYGLLTPLIGYFVSELFFFFLVQTGSLDKMPAVWICALVSIAFTTFSVIVNVLSIKTSGHIQQVSTIIKFVPIILALIIGIVLPTTHNMGGKNSFGIGSFTFTGLLAGLPSILFAYDSFLGVGQLTNKTKGGSKTISKVVLVGLVSITIVYSLLAISAMLHGGSIVTIISDSLPISMAKGVNIFVFLTLFISGYGVLNGITAAAVSSIEQMVHTNGVAGARWLKKKMGDRSSSIIYIASIMLFGFIVSVIPAIFMDTDQYVDAVSNFPTLFFFVIYATTILMYLIKRDKIPTKKMNNNLFKIASIGFISGTFFVAGYQLFYGFTIKLFMSDLGARFPSGLFAPSSHTLNNLEFSIMFFAFLALFFIIPAVNYVFIKYLEKRDPFDGEEVTDFSDELKEIEAKSIIEKNNKPSDLIIVGEVLIMIGAAMWCMSVIGMIWGIPMLIRSSKRIKGDMPVTVEHGIVSILFFGLIGGILALIGWSMEQKSN